MESQMINKNEMMIVMAVGSLSACVVAIRKAEQKGVRPYATYGICILCTAIHVFISSPTFKTMGIGMGLDARRVCFSVCYELGHLIPKLPCPNVKPDHALLRAVASPFFHGDWSHLAFNMCSLIIKGAQLEPLVGVRYFLTMSGALAVLCALIYVIFEVALYFLPDGFNMGTDSLLACGVGYSGVLFAYKTLLSCRDPDVAERQSLGMIPLPPMAAKWGCWIELVAASIMIPNASFAAHFAGIIAGYLLYAGWLNAFLHDKQILGIKYLQGAKIFKMFDKDSNNKISSQEVDALYTYLKANHPDRLNQMTKQNMLSDIDNNNDGKISQQELSDWLAKKGK